MKNILVPLEDHRGNPSVFRTAELIAGKFGSRVEVVPLGPDFDALIAAHFAFPIAVGNEKAQRELLTQLRAIFEERNRSLPAGQAFAWNGDDLFSDIKIGAYGRVFDLTIVGRPSADPRDPRQATLETVLFESGRPILVAPPQPPKGPIGEVIVIAWNASTETARTVGFAMPFLKGARKVIIVSVNGAMSPGPGPELLAESLKRHGLDVTHEVLSDNSQSAGRLILARVAAEGADLLLKGGYTQSRLRQMVFGGTTSQILAEAEIPVFMAH
ncbi:universal stress protein [Telmatospirillum siberiense]|uniref:Universal stress protein n=1 Tax=Telmatospirillum siberiense TaxID=382514 RepID=A0A2N3PS65_9PROT|nr:universal stress protein [Telmatospirillum siberiense]PKU23245.1 universal stress protein [Telmatospirillum siberiense]